MDFEHLILLLWQRTKICRSPGATWQTFLCCYETTKLRFWIAHDRTVTLICILCIYTCIYRYVIYTHKAYRNTSWKCLCLRPQGAAQLPLHAATYTHDHRSTDPKNPKDPKLRAARKIGMLLLFFGTGWGLCFWFAGGTSLRCHFTSFYYQGLKRPMWRQILRKQCF